MSDCFSIGDQVRFNIKFVPGTEIDTRKNYPNGGIVRSVGRNITLFPGEDGEEYHFSGSDLAPLGRTIKWRRYSSLLPKQEDQRKKNEIRSAALHRINQSLSDRLRKQTKELHGHPRFYEIVESLKDLHSKKNYDYAAGGNPLGNFDRVAKILGLYPDLDLSSPTVVALVYMMKQLDATLWMLSNKHTAKIEGISGRLEDVAVYAILATVLDEERVKTAVGTPF